MEQAYELFLFMEHTHSSISDTKLLFNLLRHQSRKLSIPQTLSTESAFISKPEEKANAINDFFNSVYKRVTCLLFQTSVPTTNLEW